MAEGFFRSKKGFTVVQNEITKDVNISLKAKGLYLVIQAYISMPDRKWTKEDFRNLTKEGKKAFDSAWKELKDFGYLKVHFMPDNGVWRAEYELLDEPDLGPHTLYHSCNGTVSSNNLTRAEKKRQADLSVEENKQVSLENISAPTAEKEENHRYPPFGTNGKDDRYPLYGSNANGSNGNGNNGYGSNANGGNNNKDYNIKPDIKTDLSNPYPNQTEGADAMGEKYSMEFIEQHYELEPKYVFAPQEKSINTVKDVLYDVLNTQKPVLRVMGEDKPAAVVKSRLLKLDRMDIDYAIEQYQKQVTKVHNHKAYMLTVLYQAKSQGNWISVTVLCMIFMEQAEKLMAQEVERMDKKSEHVRIPVLLRINNPRHQFVYNILENVENRSAYIREAVIYYYRHNGISTEEDDILEDIRKVVKECNSQLLNELDKRMESKNSIDYKKLKNMF